MSCITAGKFNMKADILRLTTSTGNVVDSPNEWVATQDPDSGEIIRTYAPVPDDPATPEINETVTQSTFDCMARAIINGGIRVAGTTESFSNIYEANDYIYIWFPPSVTLSRRDQITNVRDRHGNVIWKEEEIPGSPPTVFNVNGVVPMPDPFGRVIEYRALLERADNQ